MLGPGSDSFKDTPPADGARCLSGYSLLSFSGADAGAFLQAQTMNDVRALSPRRWQWNGWLNARGRVVCLFALWQRDADEYLALLPDFPAAELQPLLQRYVFRSRLRIAAREDLVAAAASAPAPAGAAADLALEDGTGWSLDFSGDGAPRRLLVLPAGDPGLLAAQDAADASWREADLAHGLPRLDAGQREAWTPQMLSLQRLRAFSLAKGCYPGQEIVARTHYLGQAKRELVRLQGAGLQAGAQVMDGERVLGTVVCAGSAGGSALAVLQAGRDGGPWQAGGAPAAELPLLGGLQRPA
jgi:folate-binding protein YgfZ